MELRVELWPLDLVRLRRHARHRGGYATFAARLLASAKPQGDGRPALAVLTGADVTRFVRQRDTRGAGGWQAALRVLDVTAVMADGRVTKDWATIRAVVAPERQTMWMFDVFESTTYA
jgi:hypothetical protein